MSKSYKYRKSLYKAKLNSSEIDLISQQIKGLAIEIENAKSTSQGHYVPKTFLEKLRNIENLISLI